VSRNPDFGAPTFCCDTTYHCKKGRGWGPRSRSPLNKGDVRFTPIATEQRTSREVSNVYVLAFWAIDFASVHF
jgi:hypothetical protein